MSLLLFIIPLSLIILLLSFLQITTSSCSSSSYSFPSSFLPYSTFLTSPFNACSPSLPLPPPPHPCPRFLFFISINIFSSPLPLLLFFISQYLPLLSPLLLSSVHHHHLTTSSPSTPLLSHLEHLKMFTWRPPQVFSLSPSSPFLFSLSFSQISFIYFFHNSQLFFLPFFFLLLKCLSEGRHSCFLSLVSYRLSFFLSPFLKYLLFFLLF